MIVASAGQALDRIRSDGADELSVVTLVLVGVELGKPADRSGELLALPDVAGDGRLWGSRTRPPWLTWAFTRPAHTRLRRPPRTDRRLTRTLGEIIDRVIG